MACLSRRAFLALSAVFVAAAAPHAASVSLDEFMELSERLVGRKNLDRRLGETLLKALNADADASVTLAYLVQSNGNPTPEQRVLSAAIVRWWHATMYAPSALAAPWFSGW
jgi:hypothetical protein